MGDAPAPADSALLARHLGLPDECNALPPLTLLWLGSRMDWTGAAAAERKKLREAEEAGMEDDGEKDDTDSEATGVTEVATDHDEPPEKRRANDTKDVDLSVSSGSTPSPSDNTSVAVIAATAAPDATTTNGVATELKQRKGRGPKINKNKKAAVPLAPAKERSDTVRNEVDVTQVDDPKKEAGVTTHREAAVTHVGDRKKKQGWVQWLTPFATTTPRSVDDYREHLIEDGSIRRLNRNNMVILFRLLPLLWPRVIRLAVANPRVIKYALLHLSGVVLKGILPTASLWAKSKLLDLVQDALSGKKASWRAALKYSTLDVLFALGSKIYSSMIKVSTDRLRKAISTGAERAYISAKLDLMQQAKPTAIQEALVSEAGTFAGFQNKAVRRRNPRFMINFVAMDSWEVINSLSSVFSDTIEITTKMGLLLKVLRTGSYRRGDKGSYVSLNNALLVVLPFAPAASMFLREWVFKAMTRLSLPSLFKGPRPSDLLKTTVSNLISDDNYYNEVVLFNLKDWIMQQWQSRSENDTSVTSNFFGVANIVNAAYTDIVTNLLSVLIATRFLKTNLTQGALHTQLRLGESLIHAYQDLQLHLTGAFQAPFLLAAAFSAAEGVNTIYPKLDFEDHRVSGGMRIEARGLSFGYGKGKPVLKDVDLVIEAGESLAVVGLNGSGKTTLVKTLLGLQDHDGEVLINGREIREYDAASLHGRMSCLFQDYCKYDLPLRSNVAVGDTKRMDNDELVHLAMERGDAKYIDDLLPPDMWLTNKFTKRVQANLTEEGLKRTKPRVSSQNEWLMDRFGGTMNVATTSRLTGLFDRVIKLFQTDSDQADERDARERPAEMCSLSGGQWQRVALSRAFMRADTADLIVFDEPSAALDPLAEAALFERIHNLSRVGSGATTIFISHRFNTVRKADNIAFVDKGRIVEYGSHDELMELGGRYFECFDLQRRGFQ